MCSVVTQPKIAEFSNGTAFDAEKIITGINSSSQLVVLRFTTNTNLHCTGSHSPEQLCCYFKAIDYIRVKLQALDPTRLVRIFGNIVEDDVSNAAWNTCAK